MSDETKNEAEEPRIHVDEDWKKSVQEEKERLRAEQPPEPEEQEQPPEPERPRSRRRAELPEPTLEMFLAGIYSQALVAMGAMENPVTGKKERRPEEASYLIDTLSMLKNKMQGNLSTDEEAYLRNMLTDLRMRYVTAPKADAPE